MGGYSFFFIKLWRSSRKKIGGKWGFLAEIREVIDLFRRKIEGSSFFPKIKRGHQKINDPNFSKVDSDKI